MSTEVSQVDRHPSSIETDQKIPSSVDPAQEKTKELEERIRESSHPFGLCREQN